MNDNRDNGAPVRIHVTGGLQAGRDHALPERQAHHVTRVLRLASGDALTLFNGDGVEYDAVVARASRDGVMVKITGTRPGLPEPALDITLGQALSSGERMDYTVQKAVELGVGAVHPLSTRRSVVRLDADRAEKRVQHWQSVVIAACEQCGRSRVPAVGAVTVLDAWLAQGGGAATRLLLSPRSEKRLRDLPRPDGPIVLLAGPEGGLTRDEEDLARRFGYESVRLGPRVLRTETAAVAALAAMQALWGDF
jgi:16S rRNA (uracil1498-N3)-methyltransferase